MGTLTLGQTCTEGGTISEHDPDGDTDRSHEFDAADASTPSPNPRGGVSEALRGLCQKITERFHARGAAVVIISGEGAETTLASSDADARRMSELEFSMGEGPNRAAFDRGRPVLTPDMSAAAKTTWPAYAAAAYDAGLGATFVFPLHVGAVSFGVLAIYYSAATNLTQEQLNTGLGFATIATEILLDSESPGPPPSRAFDEQTPQEFRSEIYQAQGMVMVALGVGLAEALARMRAHAYATEQKLTALAAGIVAGTIHLTNDRN